MRAVVTIVTTAVVVAVGLQPACDPAPSSVPRVCNGAAPLCDRALDDVTFAGAHNAMSSRDDAFLGPNQTLALPGQLRLGVRAFMLDTWPGEPDRGDGVLLCHGSCDLGAIPLVDELTRLKAFLDDEPATVVQLLIEDHAPIGETRAAFEAAGLFDDVYVHDGGAFPTLGALIDDGTRLFVTAENQRDAAEPWFHPMFDHVQDTPFTFVSVDELSDDASCTLNRGAAGHPLFLVNHWLGNPLPDDALADDANAFAVLDDRVRRCADLRGRRAHIVALDFVEVGALSAVVAGLNGLPAAADRD